MEKCRANFALGARPVSDTTVFVGAYPFRNQASATWAETSDALHRLGIDRGIVSPIEAVFQEDGPLSEERLAGELTGHEQWTLFKTIDPSRPGWRDELRRARDAWPVGGIRLFSLYHGYTFSSGVADGVFAAAAELGLPLQIFCRMQDRRMQRRLLAAEPSLDDVRSAIERAAPTTPLLFSGLSMHAVARLMDIAPVRNAVFFDTSRLQGPWKTFGLLSAAKIEAHLAFGSLWPINSPECPLTQVQYAALSEAALDAVLQGNGERFLSYINTIKEK